MDYYTPPPPRRHNPIDSICRKLQTIQWRGDREPNSPFQIPKLSSSSYDSPQSSLRHNLEAILKKGSLYRDEVEKGVGMPTSSASQNSILGPSLSLSGTPTCNPNVTYTITSTLGERGGADGTDYRQVKPWQKYSSTPCGQQKDSPYFTLTQGLHSVEEENQSRGRDSRQYHTFTPDQNTLSYNLNFGTTATDTTNSGDSEFPYPALVVKRLSLGDGGSSLASQPKRENMAEVSLICEENLLDTIFHACDTQRRGKVYVSHIVDYLRHTTSRSSGDSGLDELCNMLDPEQKDVSIDLETYHAVMREWIDDCRNNGDDRSITQDLLKPQDSLSAKRSMLLNMTSGSLEAFGGEASRAEFETSELVYCVADLQMCKQKLQDEVRKLKLVVESMEESNLKLAEENEELRNQARISQQLAQKEKMLTEEVEEMKATLSCTEEGRARASAHSKNVEKENQSLIAKIASLQEENFKVVMETDELQKRIKELCDINTDLQVQIHSFDAVISEKEAVISEKSRQIDELQSAVEEYSSITELLRVHKNKLENQIQMILPDLAGVSLPWSVAYRLNQGTSGSLQTELALAQSPLEPSPAGDHVPTTMSFVSPLDETLDKEVLLMLQGPTPEQMSLEFKSLLNKLKMDFGAETSCIMFTITRLLDDHTQPVDNMDTSLQTVQAELEARRADWVLSLDQLAQYTETLEKELIKMASNMRRSRTEILHLSVRVQEQENQKRQLCDELEQLKTPQDSREASCQTPAPEDEPGDDLDWDEEFALQDFLKNELAERNCQAQFGSRDGKPEESADKREEEDGEERWTVVDTAEETEARDTSTPLSAEVQPGQGRGGDDSAACSEPETVTNSQPLQGDAAVSWSTNTQAVSFEHPEADAQPDPTHTENTEAAAVCEGIKTGSCNSAQTSNSLPDQDLSNTSVKTPPAAADMVSPNDTSPGLDETITPSHSTPKTNDDQKTETLHEDDLDSATGDMIRSKSISQNFSADRSAAEDSTSLLPSVPEEEESVQDITSSNPLIEARVAATDRLASSGPASSSDGASLQAGSFLTNAIQLGSGMTSNPDQSEVSEDKKDSDLRGKNKRELELSQSMEAVEHKDQEKQSDASVANEKETEMSGVSESSDFKGDRNSLSATDKEIETEFQRLALGFKCDMFTLEKRLRLEERSRDLAEENVRREVSSCQGLLQALIPLCEDDNQSMEIIQRLQKNLDILIQSMTRVSSRSEMLGAIHQESRIGKAVEVMIQHVENLRRLYTKEHAELLELREALMQNERSFGSQTERDDFRGKKQTSSQYYKSSARRVSIAAIPRSGLGNMHFDMSKTQDCSEAEQERLTRRSPCPSPSSSTTSSDPGMTHSLSHSLTSSRVAAAAAVARGGRGVWLWLAIVVVLAGLLALLASLVMQPAVDAAPVGTGDSWMTIQQLLWPYAGLRHNAQPPV